MPLSRAEISKRERERLSANGLKELRRVFIPISSGKAEKAKIQAYADSIHKTKGSEMKRTILIGEDTDAVVEFDYTPAEEAVLYGDDPSPGCDEEISLNAVMVGDVDILNDIVDTDEVIQKISELLYVERGDL